MSLQAGKSYSAGRLMEGSALAQEDSRRLRAGYETRCSTFAERTPFLTWDGILHGANPSAHNQTRGPERPQSTVSLRLRKLSISAPEQDRLSLPVLPPFARAAG
jgi:hypothetical protein